MIVSMALLRAALPDIALMSWIQNLKKSDKVSRRIYSRDFLTLHLDREKCATVTKNHQITKLTTNQSIEWVFLEDLKVFCYCLNKQKNR